MWVFLHAKFIFALKTKPKFVSRSNFEKYAKMEG